MRLYTITGADWSKRYPRIVEAAAKINGNAILDAEVVWIGSDGVADEARGMLGEIDVESSSSKRGGKNEGQLTEEQLYTFVFDLLVRVRPPSGSEVQEGPHRLDRADMPWILLRLGRHEQQFGGPAQPDDPVRAFMKHGKDRHLLPFLVFAMIVPFEVVIGG